MSVQIALTSKELPSLPYQKIRIYNDCIYGANRDGKLYECSNNMKIIATHDDWVTDFHISDSNIFSCSNDKSVFKNNSAIGYHSDKVIQMIPDNHGSILTGSLDGSIAYWKEKVEWLKTDSNMLSFDYRPNLYGSSTIQGDIKIFDIRTKESIFSLKQPDMVQKIHFDQEDCLIYSSGASIYKSDLRNAKEVEIIKTYPARISVFEVTDTSFLVALSNGLITDLTGTEFRTHESGVTAAYQNSKVLLSSHSKSSDLIIERKDISETIVLKGTDGILHAKFSNDKLKVCCTTTSRKEFSWDLITNSISYNKEDLLIDDNYLAAWATLKAHCGNLYLVFEESKISNSEIYFEDLGDTQKNIAKPKFSEDRVNIGVWVFNSLFRNLVEKSMKTIKTEISSPSAVRIRTSLKNSPVSPISPSNHLFKSPTFRKTSIDNTLLTEDNRSHSTPLFYPKTGWPYSVSPITYLDFPCCVENRILPKQFTKNKTCESIKLEELPSWAKQIVLLERIPFCIVSKLTVLIISLIPGAKIPKSKLTAHRYIKLYKIIKHIKETSKITKDIEIVVNGYIIPEAATLCSIYFLFSRNIQVEHLKKAELSSKHNSHQMEISSEDVAIFYRFRE
eukprot:NODE_226_length_12301_cov_1.446648.p3 type:complete len:618 gc:universal NODE_226_length_12301_cov_1.446648:2471-618(-)